ncbi:hypothetical protein EI427_21800 [Flammeovirga pectinis]|uniref:Uncharacterized protein n=1 Tax=Flammeovirga pectinis TaxID=2494373 RepID=A0A3S9P9V6_9BACT|nr:hypothetical protein [Flammeovirga pectinis]AZQ64862.1 hypothetical protein EI427_21800 [Flammeovirga pectinis]
MKNLFVIIFTVLGVCFTTNAMSDTTDPKNENDKYNYHVPAQYKTVQKYQISVGRGATFFGISKELSKVSGKEWSWEIVDTVIESHHYKYGKNEILKPEQIFLVSI